MNDIAQAMRDILEAAEYLKHVGVGHDDNPPGRGSGRYEYGSGENAYQRIGREFYDRYLELHRQGMSEKDIAKELGCLDINGKPSTGRLRDMRSAAKNNVRKENVRRAKEMDAAGYTRDEIAKELGLPGESSVRSLLNGNSEVRMNRAEATAEELKRVLEERGKFIDIGAGVEGELSTALGLNISETRLSEALYLLEEEGYVVKNVLIPQSNNPAGQKTITRVLAPPGTDPKELRNYANIVPYTDYISHDNGDTIDKVYEYPSSMDSSRLMVRYSEDGGKDKDGVMEIRRGCADLDLKGSHYCQARILVDGSHYIKGMAVYGDDDEFPPGVDVIFNTNKSKDVPVLSSDPNAKTVLKPIKKDDPDNPFGSLVKDKDRGGQYYYEDPVTGEKKLGLINKTRDEGDWDDWADSLPSQFVTKQPLSLINKQLDLTIADKKAELEEINTVTNPTLRQKLLIDFAGKCDKAAVDLKAAPLPNQKYRVILPLTTAKDNECYAPNLPDGTMVALVRFPHAGPFEIPTLRVNNNIKEGDAVISKNAVDAIGINSKVANVLSGADFDGDTVMVIPLSDSVRISGRNPYGVKERLLADFDPHSEYAERAGMTYMTKSETQKQMGIISNLITDMYIKGASDEEIVRATKHSMVVIDAEKHKLDYKRSEKDNGIKELKAIYQKHTDDEKFGGASTIISQAKSEQRVLKRQGAPRIDKETGKVWYKTADDARYYNKKGELVEKTTKSTKMAETNDAFSLVADRSNPLEVAYAKFANTLKETANSARKAAMDIKATPFSKSAYLAYKKDIDELLGKVKDAEANRPRERAAQTLANANIRHKMDIWKAEHPELSNNEREYKAQKKKIATKELTKARLRYGASRSQIVLTDRQWQAINLGAVNKSTLEKIFRYADMDDIRAKAMPRDRTMLTPGKEARMRAMKASGYSNAEIARQLGVSVSTVSRYVKADLEAIRLG